MMIEPTESEFKEELDFFIDAMKSIAEECENEPETVLNAPHTTRIARLDETRAARQTGPALETAGVKGQGRSPPREQRSQRSSIDSKG